jgi:hypothetical protein
MGFGARIARDPHGAIDQRDGLIDDDAISAIGDPGSGGHAHGLGGTAKSHKGRPWKGRPDHAQAGRPEVAIIGSHRISIHGGHGPRGAISGRQERRGKYATARLFKRHDLAAQRRRGLYEGL